jgi:HEAT repeat protein
METRRQLRSYIVVALIAAALIGWLSARYLAKRQLIRSLSSNDMSVRVAAARQLLEMQKLADALPAQPIIRRSKTAEALGEIAAQEGYSRLGEEALRVLGVILQDQEEAPRRWARRALAKQGKRAVPTLMAALSAGGGTKDEAVTALQEIGPKAAPMLRFLLTDGSGRGGAAEALVGLGDVGIATLVRACYSHDTGGLRAAGLGNMGLSRIKAAVEPALYNLEPLDRSNKGAAISALGLIGDRRAVPKLIPFLEDSGSREGAVTALGQIGDSRAVEPILNTLPETERRYSNAAILALRRIGLRAFPALMRELRSSDVLMRRAAAAALVGSRSAVVTDALAAALRDSDAEVRASAALALGWKDNLPGVGPLAGALGDPDWRVVDAAVEALGSVGANAVPKLVDVLGDPDQDVTVRYQVARSLAAVGRPAVSPLLGMLSRPDPEVQKWVAVALGEIGDAGAVPLLEGLHEVSEGDLRWVLEEQLRRLKAVTGSQR